MSEQTRAFRTVLVANRGEIARRVIRTLRALGIRSVAVYSDADAGALHVREADVAYRLGPAEAAHSYLDIDAVLDAARRSGADAIHPGYGFLSENADFARACERAGIVFIGPPASAIETMGDKVRAKRLVAENGVPVTAGVDDRSLDDAALAAAAERLGMPVLVKPSAGGGGMGMVEVREASALPEALRTARRVAKAAFGDDALFVERLVERPRHIEVQVLADAHGNIVHLGERECTLQRRHQKVIEEAPSPAVDDALRARLGEAACAVARSVGYTGVGTIEFLVPSDDPTSFSFMEMNTRLQVEHPVTELVAGIAGVRGVDLVEQQLRVAAGHPLAFVQDNVQLSGHAVEARVYAEDADRGFLPATGRVLALHEAAGDGIRLDGMLTPGLEITDDYDPMLCKVIAFGDDRDEAFARLSSALRDTCVLGVTTNVPFLVALVDDPEVRAGHLDTGFIARMLASAAREADASDGASPLFSAAFDDARADTLLAAALLVHDDGWRAGTDAPWSRPTGWRLGAPASVRYTLADRDGRAATLAVHGAPDDARIEILAIGPSGPELSAESAGPGSPAGSARLLHRDTGGMLVQLRNRTLAFRAARDGDDVWLFRDGATTLLRLLPTARSAAERGAAAGASGAATDPRLRSPMPGTVVSVDVADADAVEEGGGILVIEAMKMEHRLTAPRAGIVRVSVAVGDRVAADQELAVIEPAPTKEGRP